MENDVVIPIRFLESDRLTVNFASIPVFKVLQSYDHNYTNAAASEELHERRKIAYR